MSSQPVAVAVVLTATTKVVVGPVTPPAGAVSTDRSCLGRYAQKWRGQGKPVPAVASHIEMAMSALGSLVGMIVLTALHYHAQPSSSFVFVTGSFGATAVLVYASPSSPLAQPRHVIGGHVLSAIVGVSLRKLLVELPACEACTSFVAALAVTVSIVVMQATGTLHPPGGATALIAVLGDAQIRGQGYLYVLMPAMTGAVIMVTVGLIINNAVQGRHYPVFW